MGLQEWSLLKEWHAEKLALESENYNMKLRINFLEEKLQMYMLGTSRESLCGRRGGRGMSRDCVPH